MEDFEIITLDSGIKTLRSSATGETFHPVIGPMAEARRLHVEQQRLVERATAAKRFVIWDVGLGGAANALAAIEALSTCDAEVTLHSFDRTIVPLKFAFDHAAELAYPARHSSALRSLLERGSAEIFGAGCIRWHLHLGDFSEEITVTRTEAPHAIFYDPYSPATNGEMWTLAHFRNLWQRLSPDAPCLLTNYTRSTAVRVTLLLAGFFVGRGIGIGEKEETTIATNSPALLDLPLGIEWLKRVRASTNATPLISHLSSPRKIDDRDYAELGAHPQFAGAVIPPTSPSFSVSPDR